MEDDHEKMSTAMRTPDESIMDDNFTLSGAATPAQDEPGTGILKWTLPTSNQS